MNILRCCVFCGSSDGAGSAYVEAARALGGAMAARSIGLVFGGSRLGLMGQVASAALDAGGDVIGVIPQTLLAREIAFERLRDLRVVGSMHERKALMAELSDGFIALPGGFGTLDEFFEIVTWAQLGLHRKPVGLLNVGGYFDKLVEFVRHAEGQRFIRPEHRNLFVVETDALALVDQMRDIAAERPPGDGASDVVHSLA